MDVHAATPTAVRLASSVRTRNSASRPTLRNRPEPHVHSQGKPSTYAPATGVTPRWWTGYPVPSKIGSCTYDQFGVKPVDQTIAPTPASARSRPSGSRSGVQTGS